MSHAEPAGAESGGTESVGTELGGSPGRSAPGRSTPGRSTPRGTSGRSRKILTNFALLAVSTLFSLLLLEQGFRIFLFGWDSLSIAQMNSLHGIGKSGMLRASEVTEVVYELEPDLRTRFKLTPFETNRFGMRDQEYELAKPESTFRIAMVGDSFTLPSGVKIEEAFHSLLEDRLNHEGAGRRYEVLNFGVGGYSLRQYVGVVEDKATPFEPDLILIGYCGRNDHKHPAWHYKREWKRKPIEYSFFSSFVLQGIRHARATKGYRHPPDVAVQPRVRRKHKKYLDEYLGKLAAYREARGVPVAVVLLDVIWTRVPYLEQRLAELGVPFLNASETFRGRELDDYILNPLDSHPNRVANQIFADDIFAFLTESASIIDLDDQAALAAEADLGPVQLADRGDQAEP